MVVRKAILSDIPRLMEIRLRVKENVLSNPARFSETDYAAFIQPPCRTWVSIQEATITGFCSIDLVKHNVWALFVDPEFEKKGAARYLIQTALFWYFLQSKEALWLTTDGGTRAEKFYRAAGFQQVASPSSGELKFEMSYSLWTKLYGVPGSQV